MHDIYAFMTSWLTENPPDEDRTWPKWWPRHGAGSSITSTSRSFWYTYL